MEYLINLRPLRKIMTGDSLSIFFGNKGKIPEKVLILKGVVAFKENHFELVNTYLLQLREGESVYGIDMSLRFNKPEYQDYNEVFLFVDKQGPDIAFRALAKEVIWCDFEE
jgi:hypothetical protein